MAAERSGSTQGRTQHAGWRAWARVAAIAAGLLLVSEALWLWQTWPVRDLLQPEFMTPAARRP
jgi:hypothetical protein